MKQLEKYNFAVIFDMDGVIIDNTKYHVLAWQKYARKLGVNISAKTVKEKIMGRLGSEIVKQVLKKDLNDKELKKFNEEREAYYRKIYAKAIKPTAGLPKFLKQLKVNKVKFAMASSAPPVNVAWVLKRTKLKKYFTAIIDSKAIKRGKPNPDIFLKAARKIKALPKNCIVFEDAFMGIEAAKRAKMKVAAIASTHSIKDLKHADLLIKDFRKLNLAKLSGLIG